MSDLQLRAVVTDRQLDVQFSVSAGEVLAVLGPNGAGKSTALHVIAGLVRPDAGEVRLGERVLTDTVAGVNVATHDRRVGLLLQDPLLFPHLSVAANVAFGLNSRRRLFRIGPARDRETALRWLREVDAEQLADRKPRQLSGGQAQRVAIARALAADPEMLLLDEPLAGLDVAAAASIRTVLRGVVTRSGCAVILITHDLLDVFTLADRVLVLESGKIAEIGPVAEILGAPRSHFGARIAGVNLVSGTIGARRRPAHSIRPELARHCRCCASCARRRAHRTAQRRSRCSRRRVWPSTRSRRMAARATPSRRPWRSWTPAGRRSWCAEWINPTGPPVLPPASP